MKRLETYLGNQNKHLEFTNPTKETPVETSRFLKHLNLSWIDQLLQQVFPRFHQINHKLYPRVRLLFFQKLRPDLKHITEAYRVLQADPEIAQNLGFNPDDLPTYETIRHFINDHLTDHILEQFFYTEVKTIEQELNRYGETLTKEAVEDATIITAKRADPEAEYNGYYEDNGWKKDLLMNRKHKVFLAYQNLGINDSEDKALPMNLQKLQEINLHIEEITVDGKYPTYENIATAKHRYATTLFYRPQDNWVHNPLGDIDEINKQYQKHWHHPQFKIHADLKYQLNFLYQRGDHEWVGAYYRNNHVQMYNRKPVRNKKKYRSDRNTDESFNNYLKQHMGFETSLPKKGTYQAFKHTTLCLIAINAVALTRLQNGITKNLTSVAYLT